MAYKVSTAPYVRAKKTTFRMMIELAIGLAIVWFAAIAMSFYKLGPTYGVRAILIMVIALATTAVADAITSLIRHHKEKDLWKIVLHEEIHNYSWITAMIFALLCPVWTNYYVVILGSLFSTVVVKNFFGGFGKNIFNPAAMGRIFVQLCFKFTAPSEIYGLGLDSTGATLTSVMNSSQSWLGSNALGNYSIVDILAGHYFGTMGEPFTILILVIGIILVIRGVINWRAPAFYLGTVAVTSLLIGVCVGMDNPFIYLVYHLGLGGLMFGAIFMITDPVTTPTSGFGNCIIGILAAFMTMLIRICTNNAEGVVYSIALMNLITPAIDHFITARTNRNLKVKYIVIASLLVLVIGLTTLFAFVTKSGLGN